VLQQNNPEVGMGATIYYWTDRQACTIVDIDAKGKTITVREDFFTRKDNNGMSECQSYDYRPNPNGPKHVFTLRKNGRWVMRGSKIGDGAVLGIGSRRQYYDYSF
jgi:hypothetical protein